jgi:hypothetical protein
VVPHGATSSSRDPAGWGARLGGSLALLSLASAARRPRPLPHLSFPRWATSCHVTEIEQIRTGDPSLTSLDGNQPGHLLDAESLINLCSAMGGKCKLQSLDLLSQTLEAEGCRVLTARRATACLLVRLTELGFYACTIKFPGARIDFRPLSSSTQRRRAHWLLQAPTDRGAQARRHAHREHTEDAPSFVASASPLPPCSCPPFRVFPLSGERP